MADVRKNFLLNAGYHLLVILTPLITTPYLSRVLGPDGVGQWAFTYSVAGYFVMIAMLGMATYGVRSIAVVKNDRAQRSRIFFGAYGCQLLSASALLVFYLIYLFAFPQVSFLLSALWVAYVLSAAFDISWLFFGMEDFSIPTFASSLVKVCEVALVFGLVHDAQDVWAYVVIVSFGALVNQVALCLFARKYVEFSIPTKAEVLSHFKPNLKLLVPVLAVSLYTSMDKIMLGALSSMDQVGFYEYSEKMSKFPLAAITALGTVMLPRMADVFAQGNREKGLKLLHLSMWFMLVSSLAFTFGIAAIAPEFCPIFFGPGYDACVPLMILLSVVVVLISATNVIGRQYMLPSFRDNQFTASLLIGAAVNLPLNFALIPHLGAMGVAIATVVAEFAVLVSQCAFVRGELPLKQYAADAIPFAVIGLIMLACVRAVTALVANLLGLSVGLLVVQVSVGACVYALLSLLYCVKTKNELFYSLINRKNSAIYRA